MKRLLWMVLAAVTFTSTATAAAIIPQPQSVTEHGNTFTITPSTAIVYQADELSPLMG